MVVMSDLTRDVICNELIQASNAIKANIMSDAMSHVHMLCNMVMSDLDLRHVDCNDWRKDVHKIREIYDRERKSNGSE